MSKPLSKKEMKLLDRVYELSNESLYELYKETKNLEIGKPHYNHDERIAIGISFITDNSIKNAEMKISILEQKDNEKREKSLLHKIKNFLKFSKSSKK